MGGFGVTGSKFVPSIKKHCKENLHIVVRRKISWSGQWKSQKGRLCVQWKQYETPVNVKEIFPGRCKPTDLVRSS